MESDTGDICAVEFTSSDKGDSPVLPHLLDQIPPDERIGTVTGDGAFDARSCHTTILERGDIAVIPIRKNGRRWKEDCRFRLRPGRDHVCANRQGVRDTLFLVLPPYPTPSLSEKMIGAGRSSFCAGIWMDRASSAARKNWPLSPSI